MIYYEMLMILVSDIPQDIYDAIYENITNAIKEKDGSVITYDKWGKYLLAYKIKKSAYGIYVLVRFGVKKDKIQEVLKALQNFCVLRYNNHIMRYVFVKIGKAISDVYCRPDSLEDAPRREKLYDIDDVIARKNKYTKKAKNFNEVQVSQNDDFGNDDSNNDNVSPYIEDNAGLCNQEFNRSI